jgi:2-polyprenyl-6-methoxyphenol hydroxylase-like FAD-dependent oxidoreductase
MRFKSGLDEEVPVLVVGGGDAGLTASMLLARLGVEHLLVSARPQTSDLPKADVLNQRALTASDDPRPGLASAFSQVLARPVGTPVLAVLTHRSACE